MKHLEYDIDIAADRKTVWGVMLQPETYKEWVQASWPGSTYKGKWAKGEEILFISPEGGGTVAHIDEYKPYETVLARHVGVVNPDGTQDRKPGTANDWIGTLERYTFLEKNGKTRIRVDIDTAPAWESMFNDGWPAALRKLKEVCEKHAVTQPQ